MKNFFIFSCLLLFVEYGCQRHYPEEKKSDAELQEHLVNANKILVHDEAKEIQEFIARHEWKMQMTGTGLRYEVYGQGNGKQPVSKCILTISYKVFLLDAKLIYDADEQRPEKFVPGTGAQTLGLEEGLMLMTEGAHARFVIPSHLTHGITSDETKIPAGVPLYYDVHLLKTEIPTK